MFINKSNWNWMRQAKSKRKFKNLKNNPESKLKN